MKDCHASFVAVDGTLASEKIVHDIASLTAQNVAVDTSVLENVIANVFSQKPISTRKTRASTERFIKSISVCSLRPSILMLFPMIFSVALASKGTCYNYLCAAIFLLKKY